MPTAANSICCSICVCQTQRNDENVGRAGEDGPAFRISDLAVDTGLADLASNVDHYLYGHPKTDDGK